MIDKVVNPDDDNLIIVQEDIIDLVRVEHKVKTVVDNKIRITIPKKAKITSPLKIVYSLRNTKDIVLTVSDEAEVNINEILFNDNLNLDKVSIHIKLEENAILNLNTIENFKSDAKLKIKRVCDIKSSSTFTHNFAILNKSNVISDYNSKLKKSAATSNTNAIILSNGDLQSKFNILVENLDKYTNGDIVVKAVSNDTANIVINATGSIPKGMVGSKAYQSTSGIILNPKGRIEANPILLIEENDVKAGHGASIGKLSEEGLFYLMSRGLSRTEAEKLVIHGFINSVMKFNEEKLENFFNQQVTKILS